MELLAQGNRTGAFQGKHCAILTTSIKFFDHTAIEYMRGVSEDMGMQVDEVFSAEMQDLTQPGGTEQLAAFFKKWTQSIERDTKRGRSTAPVLYEQRAYTPASAHPGRRGVKVGIVTQSGACDNLDRMVERMAQSFEDVDIYDLSSLHIAGNCTGCLRCGYNNQCLYEGKDEVIETYRNLQRCDAILFCGFVVDRYFSARWKSFIDRMFFNTHMPLYAGKPMGMIVSGPLRQLPNMRETMEGVYGTFQARWAGFATDETTDVNAELAALADSLHFLAASAYTPPETFPSIGGLKIFRDRVFGGLNGVFPADHRYYKKHGWYDFPQREVGGRIAGFFMRNAMRIPAVRRAMQARMKDNLVMSFKKIVK